MTWNTLEYVLRMAPPPKRGMCQVTPSEGISLEVLFTVNCSGFSSDFHGLTYSFYLDPGEYPRNKHGELIKLSDLFCTGAYRIGYLLVNFWKYQDVFYLVFML